MLALLKLYRWTIFCGASIGGTLAILGAHLAARDKAMQTVCIGQGATVGVLIGMGLLQLIALESSWASAFGPFVTAFLFSLLTFFISERLVYSRMASRNTFFAFLFALLVAMGHLISALFPALESHMAQIYFGDLSTLTTFDAILTTVLAIPALIVLTGAWKPIANESFETAIFGESTISGPNPYFRLVALVLICFAVQFVGFLFTITCLFLPTALLSYSPQKGLRGHLVGCFSLAAVSAVVGFLVSLFVSRLPTVPTIVVAMFVNGTLAVGMQCLIVRR